MVANNKTQMLIAMITASQLAASSCP